MTIDNIGDFLIHPLVKQFIIKEAKVNDLAWENQEITITPMRIIAFLIFLAAIKESQRDELIEEIVVEYTKGDFEELIHECNWIAIFDDIKRSTLSLKIAAHQRTQFNLSLELNGFDQLSQALSSHDSFYLITDNDDSTDLSISTNIDISVKFPGWQPDKNNHLNLEAKAPNNPNFWSEIKEYCDNNYNELLIINDEIEIKKDRAAVVIENYLGHLTNFKVEVGKCKISRGLYRSLIDQDLSAGYRLKIIAPTISANAICDEFSEQQVVNYVDSRPGEQIIVIRKDFTLLHQSGVSLRFVVDTVNKKRKDRNSSFRIGDLETSEGDDIAFFVGQLTNLRACTSFLKDLERKSAKRQKVVSLAKVSDVARKESRPLPILHKTTAARELKRSASCDSI
jgi:hypothetical protein